MLKKIVYEGKLEELAKNLKDRKEDTRKDVNEVVQQILSDVKENGDAAIIKYAKKFDGFSINNISEIIATKEEIEEGAKKVGENFLRILYRAKGQIEEFHKNQIVKPWSIRKENGVILGQKVTPIERLAIYVPGGTAAYPSTVLMNIIPAMIAKVKEIVMFTPVKEDGRIPNVILAAAFVCGIETIYKVGGAQAIGAAAYGTKTIKKVDKIVGPGNIYVATAKKLCYGIVGLDMVAGPSEILVVADEGASPKYIAADLMSQAEHDKLSSSILITTSEDILDRVNVELERQIKTLKRKEIIESSLSNFGAGIIVKSLEEAFEISNYIAPEHIEILTKEPFEMLAKVKNAGSIFLGENSPEPLGDYMSGTNHVIPTSGTAKFYSALGVYDFVKYSEYSYYPKNVLETFKDDVVEFANLEGFDAHASSIKVRFEEE